MAGATVAFKLISLVLALALVLLCVGAAMADSTITINRDSSWDSTAEAKNATYTPYKVFDAVITTAGTVDEDTGALTSEGNVVYTVGTQALADAVNATTTLKAELASDGKYYISRKGTPAPTDAAVLADIKALVDDNPTLFPAGTAVTADTATVTLTVATDGYYLIKASNGKDAIVQTIGSVTINEKNDYPTIDKKQKKAADSTYSEAIVPAEIGTYIDYQVTVHIPADANKDIVVVDTMTEGLEYDDDTGLAFDPSAIQHSEVASTDTGYNADAAWQIKFTPTQYASYLGQDVVITYRALITEAALTDTGRENEVTLTYDNGNYVLSDHTNYTPYFGGIEKVDGSNHNTKLEGVTFAVTVGTSNFNVTPVLKGGNGEDKDDVLYYIPGGNSNTVVTGKNGLVIIRGLDNDKTYTLTETATVDGYNLLKDPHNLTLAADTGTAYTTATYDQIENNKGTELPSTGGIGTTIFYILGGLLVIGAAVVLVTRRKVKE